MLSDRSYMRAPSGRTPPSVLAWFLGILVGVFILQNVAETWFRTPVIWEYGALSTRGIHAGRIWTLLTYSVLHGGFLHIFCNFIALLLLGRELEAVLGRGRFLRLILASALGGGLAWLALYFNRSGLLIGSSAVGMGFLTVFVCLDTRRHIGLMFTPLYMEARWFLLLFGGFDLLGFLIRELPGHGTLFDISHVAHLGGIAAGWIFYQVSLARRLPFMSGAAPAIEPPAWFRRRSSRPAAGYTVNLNTPTPARPAPAATSRDSLRAEVDRILDKINLHGFGALTPEEKRVLDEARQHLNPR